jgi:hypothetical protein
VSILAGIDVASRANGKDGDRGSLDAGGRLAG